ncbi:hypothetical protein [Azospirillum rugosum]|uniref:Uncharacterized protein n=1 Tax=Azospirillum rugosum TaxID=416170 RepID=A0ABS4SSE4_9PROT|nr:hypothetical protein [Azospirillum rugosum]MBP2294310.1 hypothetical protein [Azospirillum rugosum]MDQ0527645.1 hypothetical protein [Azospirillum rugosum]
MTTAPTTAGKEASDQDKLRAERRRILGIAWRILVEERRPLVALYLVLDLRQLAPLAVAARTEPPKRERSPFIYDMR